jgi:hypothetical protein
MRGLAQLGVLLASCGFCAATAYGAQNIVTGTDSGPGVVPVGLLDFAIE